MRKRFVAISIALVVCILLCSCVKPKDGDGETVQASESTDVPRNNDALAAAGNEADEAFLPTEEDADNDTGTIEDPCETDTIHAEADDLDDVMDMPVIAMPEEAAFTSGAVEEDGPIPDNSVGQTTYDPFELPED